MSQLPIRLFNLEDNTARFVPIIGLIIEFFVNYGIIYRISGSFFIQKFIRLLDQFRESAVLLKTNGI